MFDLEETLTHVSENLEGADAFFQVVTAQKKTIKLGVHYRPYLKDTLTSLKKLGCELLIWGSGSTEYSNKVISSFDPDGELFETRLFRDHCYISPKGLLIKDLRMINRPLEKCIAVDNNTYSYGFQLDNGVPILPYTGETGDTELLVLSEYLQYLMRQPGDFRPANRRHFRYDLFEKESNLNKVMKKLLKP